MGANLSVPMYRRHLEQRLRLEGARCAECDATSFPPRERCERGCSGRLVPMELSRTGTIHALTHVAPAAAPPEFAYQVEGSSGYWVIMVDLDDGPRITGQLVAPVSVEPPSIGARVRAVTRLLYRDDDIRRYGFKFELVM